MAEPNPLVLAYAHERPQEVALLLADFSNSETTEFLLALPTASATAVLSRLSSRQLTECLERFPKTELARLLAGADHSDAISIVSHLEASSYDAIIASASEQFHPHLLRLFAFPKRTLASLASPGFLRVGHRQSCEVVRVELEQHDEEHESPLMVVCDEDGHYLGILQPESIFPGKNQSRPVAEVMQTLEPLNGETNIATAMEAPQWRRFTRLPVVDDERHMIGIVTLDELHTLLKAGESVPYSLSKMLEDTTIRYFDFCADILSIVAGNRSR